MNLYGPPLKIPETSSLKNIGRTAATLGLVSRTDYLNQYLNFPQHASTYRGRVLVTERIASKAPKSHEKDKVGGGRYPPCGRTAFRGHFCPGLTRLGSSRNLSKKFDSRLTTQLDSLSLKPPVVCPRSQPRILL